MADAAATTDTLYRALRSANADPDLAHAAAEAVRDLAGENVTSVLEAKIDVAVAELRTEFHTEIGKLRGEFQTEIGKLSGEIAELRGMMITANRLNTALVVILGTGVVAMLLQVLGIVP